MKQWKFISNTTLFVLLLLFQKLQSEVTLRVLLQPPMVTLECLIININEKASVIMMCPNDVMCFSNCTPQCTENCSSNAIKCSMSPIKSGMKFSYTFDTQNSRNQGEWTCHFGKDQSSTVIFLNNTNQPITTKNAITKIVSTTSTTLNDKIFYNQTSKSSIPLVTSRNDSSSPTDHKTVVAIIVLLFLSLCLNVALIIITIKNKITSEKSTIPISTAKQSRFQKFCIKLFCVENMFQTHSQNKSKIHEDNKECLQRQVSNNIYERAESSLLQPAIVLDNYAFVGTPASQRWFAPATYDRSFSCATKFTDVSNGGIFRSNSLSTNQTLKSNFQHLTNRQDTVSPLVYDDVADQSAGFIPMACLHEDSSHIRPSQYLSMGSNLDGSIPVATMSLNNLATTGCRLSDRAVNGPYLSGESMLKDAINSRVELSKEMIHHADSLLKRADSLLNDKSQQKMAD